MYFKKPKDKVIYKPAFLVSAIDFPDNPKFTRIVGCQRAVKRYSRFMGKFSKWKLTITKGTAGIDFNNNLHFIPNGHYASN
jgi:hypothetical protein